MPTVEDYLTVFRPMAERREPVLCICLNAPFSGSFQAARNARSLLLEEFPRAEICVLDSPAGHRAPGVLVLEAVHLRDAGSLWRLQPPNWRPIGKQAVFSLPQMIWSI